MKIGTWIPVDKCSFISVENLLFHNICSDGYLTVILRTRVEYELIADEARSQSWKVSGSASSTAARNVLAKYFRRNFLTPGRKFCYISKSFLQVELSCVPRLEFVTMCDTIRSLKSTYAGSFIFDFHRKFLFLEFAARKRSIFSRSVRIAESAIAHIRRE